MKKLLLILGLLLAPTAAFGQCNGIFPDQTVCGNSSGSPGFPRPIPVPSASIAVGSPISGGVNGSILYDNAGAIGEKTLGALFDAAFCSTTGAFPVRTAGGWQCSGLGTVSVKDYGAICDGSTNDSVAVQAALTAVGSNGIRAVMVPASQNGCLINSTVTYNSVTQGPLLLFGAGPGAKILVGNVGGGIDITGSCGVTQERIYVRDITLSPAIANPAFGIRLNGIAGYGLNNINFLVSGGFSFVKGVSLIGAQQGYVHGGVVNGVQTWVYLNDCLFGPTTSSNGVDIGGGASVNASFATIDLEGGAADVNMHDFHAINSTTGIINNQTGGLGGSGSNYLNNVHLENMATLGIDVQAGTLVVQGLNDFNVHTIKVHSGARSIVENSTLNGTVVYDSGSFGTLRNNRLEVTAITNNTAAGNLFQENNSGAFRPTALPSYFNTATYVTSNAAAAGIISTFSANPSVGGNWGIQILGAGAGGSEIYTEYGGPGPTVGSTVTGDTIYFKSAPGGTTWASIGGTAGTLFGAPTGGAQGTGTINMQGCYVNGSPCAVVPSGAGATVREVLTAPRTYFVRTDGSDSNTCLVNSAGGACLTIQHAYGLITSTIDLGGQAVTIQIADGTYSAGLLVAQPWTGGGSVTVQGNCTTPSNVHISTTSSSLGGLHVVTSLPGILGIKCLKITSTNIVSLWHTATGTVQFGNLVFGATGSFHIAADAPGAFIQNVPGVGAGGNYTIAGGAVSHILAQTSGALQIASLTITLTGTPAWTSSFVNSSRLGLVKIEANTYSGAATGPRFSVDANGIIYSGTCATFPGDSAGITNTQGLCI